MRVNYEAPLGEGVWQIYIHQPGEPRLLDGETTDRNHALVLWSRALRSEPEGTVVQLVSPAGVVVEEETSR